MFEPFREIALSDSGLLEFKWAAKEQPIWAGIYLGSDDVIEDLAGVVAALKTAPVDCRCLVTLGSMAALKILGAVDFGRVIFYDININEFVKLDKVIRHIVDTPFDLFRGFGAISTRIHAHPSDLMPSALYAVDLRVGNGSLVVMAPESCPDLQWKPSAVEYDCVRRNLARVDPTGYVGLPRLSLDMLTVVYVSNSNIRAADVERNIRTNRGVRVLRGKPPRPGPPPTPLTIGLATSGGRDTVRECLDGINRFAPGNELVVVDGRISEGDGTRDIIRDFRYRGRARKLFCDKTPSSWGAYNTIFAEQIDTPLLLLMHSDTILRSEYWRSPIDGLFRCEHVVIAGFPQQAHYNSSAGCYVPFEAISPHFWVTRPEFIRKHQLRMWSFWASMAMRPDYPSRSEHIYGDGVSGLWLDFLRLRDAYGYVAAALPPEVGRQITHVGNVGARFVQDHERRNSRQRDEDIERNGVNIERVIENN